MTEKPMSWKMTALLFVWMMAVTFGLTMAFNSTMRHEVWMIHTDFWQVAVPGDLLATAVLAIGTRVAANWHLRSGRRANLDTHRSSQS